jgi:hypothetical protein
MFTPRLYLFATWVVIALAPQFANAVDAPAGITVNLAPAQKVGTTFSLVSDFTDESQTHIAMTMPGATAPQKQEQTQEMIAHFEGEAEVLATFPNGSIQKVSLTAKMFIATSEGQPLPGLPAVGAKVVAEKTGNKKTYTIDGQPASANVAKLLDEMIDLGDEKYTDQDVFGPTGPVVVGGTWPVNSAALMTELKQAGDIEMSGAKGTAKLDAVKGSGADQVATVTAVFTVQGAKPTLPQGMAVDSMTMSGGLAGTVPATTKGVLKETMTISMEMNAHGTGNGINIKIDSAGKEKMVMEVTFH